MQRTEHILSYLGRLANLLDTKFVWENVEAAMHCRDKGRWRTMTKFKIRNNMACASQMQLEVLRRALWVQQARPQTVFNWQFWDKAAQGPKMTAYLNHGVKAQMCETTPFVNTVGAHYVASRAHIELACDSLRSQGHSITTHVGLSKGDVYPVEESNRSIVKALLEHVNDTWSTMAMRTRPRSDDLFQHIHPNHQVLLSCKPHRPGCHQWRPMQQNINADIKELQPDVIVERYLDAKYYHYDPEDIYEFGDYNGHRDNAILWGGWVQCYCKSQRQLPRTWEDNPWMGARHQSHPSQMAWASSVRTPH